MVAVCRPGRAAPGCLLMAPLFVRVHDANQATVPFRIDGVPSQARLGDSILTALLTAGARVRLSDFGDGHRSGFCLMGACHDCIVQLDDGRRVRACATPVEPGMNVLTELPGAIPASGKVPPGESS
jgi:ferredoxin